MNLLQRLQTRPDIAGRFDTIVLVDPLQYGEQKIPPRLLADTRYRFVQGSIYDPAVAGDVIAAGDTVLHLVAPVNSFTAPQTTTADDPPSYLQHLADRQIARLLFLSTADVYGDNDADDLHESDPVRPSTIYAAAKAAFEAYLSAVHAMRGLPYVAFRPVTIYGPQQYPGWLIPRVITQALTEQSITLTGDGTVRRDWIFVSDVCDLLLAALLHDSDDIHGQVFNIGTGTEADALTMTRQILTAVGADETLIRFVPDRPGDIRRQVTSAARARHTFGWAPAVPLADGLANTIAWYREHPAPPPA
ncbi:NAD-dependent epimerase/dehydratase family protein [Dactylosporangium cerinum]|uniref:NAD-dependent epimerase/dehydratase family protein n=1 Tax=Dactylosporangium cerinum TaxID=1434730 RepID=A0ABV9WD70_9ACTN